VVPAELTDKRRGERLSKAIAGAGVASRRDVEALIAAGRVFVNGQPVTRMPAWVDLEVDRVEVDGEAIGPRHTRAKGGRLTYVMLHKPKRVITTTRDPEGRANVLDLIDLPATRAGRLFPVGRLDADSTGLILLTNDGDLAHHLTHPRYEVPKRYQLSVRGIVEDADIEKLRRGLILATRGKPSRKVSMAQVKLIRRIRDAKHGDRTSLMVTLREGQNREIRRLVARLGYKVRRLERVALGPLRLKGLATGQWRMLTGQEVRELYGASGLKGEGKKG